MPETRRKLGLSGLEVSTITMGCWAIAGDRTWGSQDENDAITAIQTALDCGINCFDSAEMYGAGVSERILAKALAGKREQAIVCSKVAPVHATSKDDVFRACEQSLVNLGMDHIDLYYLHWPCRTVPIAETLQWFQELQKAGKIRAYGVSNFGKLDMTDLLAYGQVAVNQLPYNLLWRIIEHEILPVCAKANVGVACYSPLAQGLLTGKFPDADSVPDCRARTRHFSSKHTEIRHHEPGQEALTFQAIENLKAIAAEIGCPLEELSLAWLLHQPGVTTAIAGARSPKQVQANAKAMTRSLSPEILQRIDLATAPLKAAFDTNPDMWQSGKDSRYR